MLMFQQDYLTRLIDLGEEDADARADEIDDFIADAIRAAQERGTDSEVGRTA